MKVLVVYIYPQVKTRIYFPLAERFAATWQSHPPGHEHELLVILNGGDAAEVMKRPFAGMACRFMVHDNLGWDIGAYQRVAQYLPCDLLVCLGAPAHFYRPGWLARMVDGFVNYGPGLYGCTAYQGPLTHVRTTLFWCPPMLLNSYPWLIGNSKASRYEFEHGKNSFTQHTLKAGFPCVMSTWTGDYLYGNWHDHAPTKDEILVRDQHIHA